MIRYILLTCTVLLLSCDATPDLKSGWAKFSNDIKESYEIQGLNLSWRSGSSSFVQITVVNYPGLTPDSSSGYEQELKNVSREIITGFLSELNNCEAFDFFRIVFEVHSFDSTVIHGVYGLDFYAKDLGFRCEKL